MRVIDGMCEHGVDAMSWCAGCDGVHRALLDHQPDDELARKAYKARRRGVWTQEDIDLAERRADRVLQSLKWS